MAFPSSVFSGSLQILHNNLKLFEILKDTYRKREQYPLEWPRHPSYRKLLTQFLERLRGIPAFNEHKNSRWLEFKVKEFFADDSDFEKFRESIEFLKENPKAIYSSSSIFLLFVI